MTQGNNYILRRRPTSNNAIEIKKAWRNDSDGWRQITGKHSKIDGQSAGSRVDHNRAKRSNYYLRKGLFQYLNHFAYRGYTRSIVYLSSFAYVIESMLRGGLTQNR